MESKDIVIVDIFRDIVNEMRETALITSSSEVSGRYTLISDNNLKEDDVISINDIDYLVVSPTSTQFEIDADTGLDFSGNTWQAKAPYYMHGHPIEIVNRLNKKNKGIYSYQKYPLIALFQDFEEAINPDEKNYASISPTFIIANLTMPEIKADDRYDRNFRNILYPLLYDFINEMHLSMKFSILRKKDIAYTKIDRLYWGSQEGQSNLQDDYIDAIEININNLLVKELNCK